MLYKSLALLPIVALAGCGVLVMPPEGTDDADLVAFDEAVASIGCDLVTEADYLPVELQTGMGREQLLQVAQYRINAGDAVVLEGGGLRLVTGRCAPAAPAALPEAAG